MIRSGLVFYISKQVTIFSIKDRPTALIPKLKGVLTNPNCEFYPNFVAIHTLATWCKSTTDGGPRDVEMSACWVWLPYTLKAYYIHTHV